MQTYVGAVGQLHFRANLGVHWRGPIPPQFSSRSNAGHIRAEETNATNPPPSYSWLVAVDEQLLGART